MKFQFSNSSSQSALVRGVSTLALAVALVAVVPIVMPDTFSSTAYAAGSGQGGQGGQGGHGGGGGGHDDGGHDDGAEEGHSGKGKGPKAGGGGQGGQGAGQGQGSPDADSDGRGPKYGQPTSERGGKPAWAQEGIPDAELGRLNVARAPDRVINQAMDEALATLATSPEMIAFYSLSLPEMRDQLANNWDNLTIIDSPVSNLGLLNDVLDGTSNMTSVGVVNSPDVLAAVFLGTASDKSLEVTPEVAFAVSAILGHELTEAEATALAADAESIREAIVEGHG